MRRKLLLLFTSLSSLIAVSQSNIVLPDLPGYKTLKCDFHMHTVSSDGRVWPITRVNEAVRDQLDAISLTEHIDFEGSYKDLKKDLNRPFEIASDYAKNKNVLIINGVEISPRVPPYHNNALFLEDANLPFDYMEKTKGDFVMRKNISYNQLMAPFIEAHKQGAFISYNHPGSAPATWVGKDDTAVFTKFHKDLYSRGMLKGIEVVNGGKYNLAAHRLAMKYGLTMLCNTDAHADISFEDHRPMTLVFAREKTTESIKEALFAGRTALYFEDHIIARKQLAEAFFKASVNMLVRKKIRKDQPWPWLEVNFLNKSSIPFTLRLQSEYDFGTLPNSQVTLPANGKISLLLKPDEIKDLLKVEVTVFNILITPEASMTTVFNVDVKS